MGSLSLSLSPSLSDRMGKRGERGRIQGERMALPAGHPFVSVRPSFLVSSLPGWAGDGDGWSSKQRKANCETATRMRAM